MNIKYFGDTDTALLEFSDRVVDETREISRNAFVDLDAQENTVSVTIEHAAELASFPQVSLEQIGAGAA